MPYPSPVPASDVELLHLLRNTPEILNQVGGSMLPELQLQQQLRQVYPDALVRAAMTLVDLRRKAAVKFSRAEEMWFDRQGLEQATSETVARHKARRFTGEVVDLCCGIGGDSLALATRGPVLAVDASPAQCLRTGWNVAVYGGEQNLETRCSDVYQFDISDRLVHIDPDRRATRQRVVRIEDYVPGLEYLQQLIEQARGGAIKLSPAANFGGKFPAAEVELISLHGECKEATIWFGELAGPESWRATVLPAGLTIAGDPLAWAAELTAPQQYIYDPDPAVVRAGLVDVTAGELKLDRLDASEEYLTSSQPVNSPFVQTFELLAELPNNLREIRGYFRSSPAGQVEIKCRRIPTNAEEIRRKLPLPGDEPRVLIFARVAGRARALVCRRLS